MKTLITSFLFLVMSFFSIAQSSLDSGLVAFYPFNGNANDESGNANNPTFIGSGVTLTTDRFGIIDKAYYFDGNTDSYIRIPADNFPTTDRTISFWFNADQMENHPTPLSYGGDVCNNSVLMTFNKGGYPNAYTILSHCAANFISAPYSEVPINNWYYFTLTISGSTQKIFINGELQETANTFSTPTFVAGKSAILGALLFTDGYTVYVDPSAGYFQGKLDDFRFYNTAMTDLEVQNLYNSEANGLVAFYPFNGNTIDESGNGHDGTINGNAALVPDRFNISDRAFTFPDQSSNISLANSVNLNLETGFTINAWIIYRSGRQRLIVDKHVCGTPNGFAFHIDWDGQIAIYLANSGWSIVKTNDTFIEDNWYMVTATYDAGTGIAKVYVDGELGASGSVTYNNFSPYPIAIGETYQNNCIPGNMDSAVDEVKIYNRPLADAEILEEYNNTYSDLVLFLPFNGNANDMSGNGNNGTVNGAALTQDRFGIEGRAYSFNGNGDFISIADNPNLFSDELTISWWYKMTEILGGERVVIGWVDGGHRYQQFFNGGQLSYLNGYNVGQSGMYFNPIYGLSDLDVWKNVVVTYKKLGISTSTTSIYVDGELKQTDNHSLAMDYAPGPDFFIGKNHNGNFFKGYLDDFRIFNHILDGTEILALYQDSTTYNPPLEDGLVAYWTFEGNTDDSTNNNNDGINYNGTFSKDRYGNDNASMLFSENDSYVEGTNPGNNLPTGNSPRTITAWIKENSFQPWGNNIFHYGLDQAAPTNFHLYTTDVIRIGNGYDYGVVFGTTPIVDSTWHFVAGVYEGGTEHIAKVYVDGKLDAAGTLSTEPNTILGSNWKIGRFMTGSNNFDGDIDELKVYNVALSDQQVWEMYKTTTTSPKLLFPGNDSTLINPQSLALDWDSTVTATSYRLVIANDSLFNTIAYDTLLTISSFNFDDWTAINFDNINWKVRTINDGGIGPWSDVNKFSIILTDVADEQKLPTEFALMQNYPNPFNPTTTITYHLPKASNVKLKVYDILGNEIATLVDEEESAGVYEINFNHNKLASGVYLYKLQAGGFTETRKMILMR